MRAIRVRELRRLAPAIFTKKKLSDSGAETQLMH